MSEVSAAVAVVAAVAVLEALLMLAAGCFAALLLPRRKGR